MSYITHPSLEHIALVKIVTMLWNQHDIRTLMTKISFPIIGSSKKEEWGKIEIKVIEKVLSLPQPCFLRYKMIGLVKPIGLHIAKWLEYHHRGFYFGINLPNELCWTPQGSVDKKKTAEAIIKDESIDILTRYRLACIYSLEKYIRDLWRKMSVDCRKSVYAEQIPNHELVVFWTEYINGGLTKLDNVTFTMYNYRAYAFAFQTAALGGNKASAKYFLPKLTPYEKEIFLLKVAKNVAEKWHFCLRPKDFSREDYTDVLCFLFSQMNAYQQVEVFKKSAYPVLNCLLHWPWQGFFLETAKRLYNYLSTDNFDMILRKIIRKTVGGYKDFDYRNLFQKFWQESPETHKQYITDKYSVAGLLSKLLEIKDEKSIKLIIRSTSLTSKEKLVFSKRGRGFFDDMIYNNEWDLLEFVIHECLSSRNEVMRFRKDYEKHIEWRYSRGEFPYNPERRDKFISLLDYFIYIYNYNKQKCVEDNPSPAKRLCK